MDTWFTAVTLGLLEGLTEFLPVSSTGHLILAGHLLGFSGEKAATFEVVIQLGAILAVVVLYRDQFAGLLAPGQDRKFAGMRGLTLLFLTSLPAGILGLAAHKTIKAHLFTPTTVAWALGIGAAAILFVEALRRKTRFTDLDHVTPSLALGIGVFQCLSLWPGFSRSAATIMGGMLLGAERKLAAEYSFIAAVPIMFAATGYDLYQNWALFSARDVPFLLIGFGVSFLSAWAAVRIFIHLLGRITLRPFACYRLVLAPVVLFFWPG